MKPNRRVILGPGLGFGSASSAATAGRPRHAQPVRTAFREVAGDNITSLAPNAEHGQTSTLRTTIDRASDTIVPKILPAD